MARDTGKAHPNPDAPSPRQRKSEARKHHYIPKMIQERFVEGDSLFLWSFDKRHPERGIERKPIKRLFRVKHLYTSYRRDGTRDTSTETRLSAIETRAGLVIDRVVAAARAGRVAALSGTDRRALVDLFISQHRRSPDIHRSVLVDQAMAELVADNMAQWEALYGPASPEERDLLMSPGFAKKMRRDAISHGAADPMEIATPVMLQRGFTIGRITAPRRAFVLGSNPFARFLSTSTRRQDLGDPSSELWMPVARDVALCSVGYAGSSDLIDINDAGIRKVNVTVALASTVFASASRELVEAYARIARRGLRIQGPWEAP